jgi:hypothetical protein
VEALVRLWPGAEPAYASVMWPARAGVPLPSTGVFGHAGAVQAAPVGLVVDARCTDGNCTCPATCGSQPRALPGVPMVRHGNIRRGV